MTTIDWSSLLELRLLQPPGEPDVVEQLTATFFEDTNTRMLRLQTAATAGDVKQVRLEAHAIKGSASLMGAVDVHVAAERLEAAASDGQPAALAALILALSESVDTAVAALKAGPPGSTR